MFTYNLSDTEYLVFKTQQNHFEVFSGHEGGGETTKLGTFRGGKWIWDSFDQYKMFWKLYICLQNSLVKHLKLITVR